MMHGFKRFGIYAMPEGAFFDAGSAWLGWDSVAGAAVAQPEVANLPGPAERLTRTPRKYGFHGTIKPPFRLAEGFAPEAIADAMADFCANAAPAVVPELEVRRLGGFVAIVPTAPCDVLADLAAATVRALDRFRAQPPEVELAKRRKAGLTALQDALLVEWGYPYVMDEFRFHLTLTGNLGPLVAETAQTALAAHFAPVLPRPYTLDSLCLMGEDELGRFHLIRRYGLSG